GKAMIEPFPAGATLWRGTPGGGPRQSSMMIILLRRARPARHMARSSRPAGERGPAIERPETRPATPRPTSAARPSPRPAVPGQGRSEHAREEDHRAAQDQDGQHEDDRHHEPAQAALPFRGVGGAAGSGWADVAGRLAARAGAGG